MSMLLELGAFNRGLNIPVEFGHKGSKLMFVLLWIYLPNFDKASPNWCYHAVLQNANTLLASLKSTNIVFSLGF